MVSAPFVYLLILVAAWAAGLSFFITVKNSGVNRLPGCGERSGCAALATSRWSRWTLLPVAAVGAVLYLIFGLLLLFARSQASARHSDALAQMIVGLSVLLAGSAAWFILLQVAVVRKACIYCNLVHLSGLTIFAIVAFLVFHNILADSTKNPLDWATKPVLAGLSGLLILVAGQLLWRPKTYAIVREESAPLSSASKVSHPVAAPSPQTQFQTGPSPRQPPVVAATVPSTRDVLLLNGHCRLNTREWPIVGSTDAKHIIALLFDYTCPTCRHIHRFLNELIELDRSWLAVLILPVPQNAACNPTVTHRDPLRVHSCQYARLAVGVWQTSPDRYEEFEKYLFATDEVPLLGLAMKEASQVAGVRIDPHRPDDQIDQIIARSVKGYQSMGIEKIPMLLLPKASVAGQFKSVGELRLLLTRELTD